MKSNWQLTSGAYREAMTERDQLEAITPWKSPSVIHRIRVLKELLALQEPIPIPAPKGYTTIFWNYPKSGPDLWDYTFAAPDPKQEGIARYF